MPNRVVYDCGDVWCDEATIYVNVNIRSVVPEAYIKGTDK